MHEQYRFSRSEVNGGKLTTRDAKEREGASSSEPDAAMYCDL